VAMPDRVIVMTDVYEFANMTGKFDIQFQQYDDGRNHGSTRPIRKYNEEQAAKKAAATVAVKESPASSTSASL